MARKDVLIRGVDDSVYRRAKAAAASKGVTIGQAVDEALSAWANETEYSKFDAEVDANRNFIRNNWDKIRSNKGKAVVVSEGRLQGVFPTYEAARAQASKMKKVALVFVVDKPPEEHEIELGPELEIQ